MGYRGKKNFDDIDNLNEATQSFFEQQRKALGKSFVFAYVWDMFGKLIAIGAAVLMFLIGALTGWLIRGGVNSNDTPSPDPPALQAEATITTESTTQTEAESSDTTTQTTESGTNKTTKRTTTTTASSKEDEIDETTTGTTETAETTTALTTTATTVTGGTTNTTRTTTTAASKTTTAAKTTAKTTTKKTTTTTKTTTVTTTTETTTAATTTAPKRYNIGTSVRCNASVPDGAGNYECAFTVTITNNLSNAISSQMVKFSIPSGCTISGRVVGGTAEISGSTLTLKSTTSLASGASTTISFTIISSSSLSASDLARSQ